jgi:hypothetical protein
VIGTILLLLVMALNLVGAVSLIGKPKCRWCGSRLWHRPREFPVIERADGARAVLVMPVCLQCEFWESRR